MNFVKCGRDETSGKKSKRLKFRQSSQEFPYQFELLTLIATTLSVLEDKCLIFIKHYLIKHYTDGPVLYIKTRGKKSKCYEVFGLIVC